jgi:hypothetical protein
MRDTGHGHDAEPDLRADSESLDPPTRRDGHRWASLVERVADVLMRRAGDDYRPVWEAPTLDELAAVSLCVGADGDWWGEAPYRTVWTAYSIFVRALAEHARSSAMILRSEPTASVSLEVHTRAIVELAARASWLMWPDLGGRARVARLHVLRRATTKQRDTLVKAMGGSTTDDDHDPLSVKSLDAYAHRLGLGYDTSRKGNWVGVEGQQAQGPTERAEWFFAALAKQTPRGTYPYLCGATHGELWRLVQGFEPSEDEATWTVRAPRIFTRFAVMATVESLIYTGRYGFEVLGIKAGMAELRGLSGEVREEFSGGAVVIHRGLTE